MSRRILIKIVEYLYSLFPRLFFLNGGSLKPLSLNLILSYSCNLKCKTCFYFNENAFYDSINIISKRKKNLLSLEKYYNILNNAKKVGIRYVTLHGGEPTMNPHFDALLNRITELGMSASFVTNGYKTINKLDTILKNNVNHISVSVDGIGNLQDKIRGKQGLYERQLKMVKLFKEKGIKFSSATYINALNYGNLFNIFLELITLNVFEELAFPIVSYLSNKDENSSINFFKGLNIYNNNTAIGSLQLKDDMKDVDIKVLIKQKNKIKKYLIENNIKNKVFFPTNKYIEKHFSHFPLNKNICNYFYSRMVISPYGEIIPCINHGMLGCTPGYILNTDILKEWNSKTFKAYRKKLKKQLIPACKRCCFLQKNEILNK